MAPPQYETKFVTVPVISETKRCPLPANLAQWPIKQSKSDHGEAYPSTAGNIDGPTYGKPNLRAVINQLSKDFCRMKDMAHNGDLEGGTLWELGGASQESDNSKREESKVTDISKRASTTIFVAMVACFAIMTISTPLLVFLFADNQWGKIVLKREAPTKATFAGLLAMPLLALGVMLTFGMTAILSMHYGWTFLFREVRNVGIMAVIGLAVGGILVLWNLGFLLPLVGHE